MDLNINLNIRDQTGTEMPEKLTRQRKKTIGYALADIISEGKKLFDDMIRDA